MDIQGENVHNFKEILLMMYVYHKAAFTFEVIFSTSTYDARWMCFNATVIWKFGHCSARVSLKIWWIITHEH